MADWGRTSKTANLSDNYEINQSLVIPVFVAMALAVAVFLAFNSVNIPKPAEGNVFSVCSKFPGNSADCEKSVLLALSNYPGNVISVDRKTVSFNAKKTPETEMVTVDAWVIAIRLESPIILPAQNNTGGYKSYGVDVVVDDGAGKILYADTKELIK